MSETVPVQEEEAAAEAPAETAEAPAAEAAERRSIWRHADFNKLWAGQTVSLFGSAITDLALPLTAIITLHASASTVGLLNTARTLPFLVLTLFAGVWVDRMARRRTLMGADLGRAICIGVVPLLAFTGGLNIETLLVVAFVFGSLTVVFDLAYFSYVPSLVSTDELVPANSRLELSNSAIGIGGPGVAGFLIAVMRAPYALIVDAVSFLVSFVTLWAIRRREPPIERRSKHPRQIFKEIGEGLSVTFRNRYVRALAGEAGTFNLFSQIVLTVFLIYAVRHVHLGAGVIGLIFSAFAVGGTLGAMSTAWLGRRLGFGNALTGSMALACLAPLALPLAAGPKAVQAVIFAAAFFVSGFGVVMSSINAVGLRQAATPNELLGRMNASYRLATYGGIPLGALLGGVLAQAIGLRAALIFGAIGLPFALLWVAPLRRLETLPKAEDG